MPQQPLSDDPNDLSSQAALSNAVADNPKQTAKKRGFFSYLLPAFFSLLLLFIGTFYWSHRPTYGAVVVAANEQPLWQIKGNAGSIRFISVNAMTAPDMKCVAWLLQDGQKPLKLGVIPDAGGNIDRRIPLPESLQAQAGDKILIVMLNRKDNRQLPPSQPQKSNEVVLIDI